MGMMTGVVEKVFAKDTGSEDQYGNRYMRSFRIEGQDIWFGLGKGKSEDVNLKIGAGFHKLAAGDTISFFYEINEFKGKEYYNVKSSKISVDKKGEGQPVQQRATAAATQHSNSGGVSGPAAAPGGSFRGNELSIKAGRAVNAAVSLVTSGHFKGSLEEALARVIALEVYADANYNELYETATKADALAESVEEAAEEPKPKSKPRAKPAPKAEVAEVDDSDFDDDIPF